MRTLLRLVVLAALGLGLVASPAYAAGELGLSWDGSTWQSSLTGTLFPPGEAPHLWVPGDSDADTFYVRNQAGDPASLHVEYDLAATLAADIQVSARVGDGAWTPLRGGAGRLTLARSSLGAGERTSVQVRAVFDPASGNASQAESVPLEFRVTLAGDAAGGPGEVPGPSGPGSLGSPAAGNAGAILPSTGSQISRWLLGLGALLVGGGIALVARSRRRARDGDPIGGADG